MAKIAQYRYYNAGNENNRYPDDNVKTWQSFCANSAFSGIISQLGIQTLPGTKIYVNSSTDPIIIGGTGILEIDCRQSTGSIQQFRIDRESMQIIDSLPNGYIVIDMIYSESEEE